MNATFHGEVSNAPDPTEEEFFELELDAGNEEVWDRLDDLENAEYLCGGSREWDNVSAGGAA